MECYCVYIQIVRISIAKIIVGASNIQNVSTKIFLDNGRPEMRYGFFFAHYCAPTANGTERDAQSCCVLSVIAAVTLVILRRENPRSSIFRLSQLIFQPRFTEYITIGGPPLSLKLDFPKNYEFSSLFRESFNATLCSDLFLTSPSYYSGCPYARELGPG